MTAIVAKVSKRGQITIPATARAAMGVGAGDDVILDVVDGELRIRTTRQVMDHVRVIARKLVAGKVASVDDFLADRRAEVSGRTSS